MSPSTTNEQKNDDDEAGEGVRTYKAGLEDSNGAEITAKSQDGHISSDASTDREQRIYHLGGFCR